MLESDGTLSVILFPGVPPGTVRDLGPRPGHGLSRHHQNDGKLMREKPPPRRKRRGLAAAGTQKRGASARGTSTSCCSTMRGSTTRQRRWSDEAGAFCGGGRLFLLPSAAGGTSNTSETSPADPVRRWIFPRLLRGRTVRARGSRSWKKRRKTGSPPTATHNLHPTLGK